MPSQSAAMSALAAPALRINWFDRRRAELVDRRSVLSRIQPRMLVARRADELEITPCRVRSPIRSTASPAV